MNALKKIKESADFIFKNASVKPKAAVIAGSGVAGFKDVFKVVKTLDYAKIPHFAKTSVQGHLGTLDVCDNGLFVFNGRVHFYEGYSPQEAVYPVRTIKALGIETLVITAAVGALNKKYRTGDIAVLKDHINFTGGNPLIGKHCREFGERFPDMSAVYDASLRKKALTAAKKMKINVYESVYFGVSGPSFETPAEVSAYRKLGGDILGMSVVYEAIAASQMKMKVLALTYIANAAAQKNTGHEDVLAAGKQAGGKIVKIIKAAL
ncbi:MAG: purine-nucleoside phosphorylase [Endomicrobium sp.]|jgi:purine-nucleoside phosphorylase|nr:purine-nucleoside phosphorylase [Endomicrobium sp.]